MKPQKLCALLCSASILLNCFTVAPYAETAAETATESQTETVTDNMTATVLRGDLNNSGTIDLTDLKHMSSYLAGSSVSILPVSADIDGNETTNNTDRKYLASYLAGSSVKIASPEAVLPVDNVLDVNVGEENCEITGYTYGYTGMVLPNSYGGLPVTGIADGVFASDTRIESIVIPAEITSIGAGAFSGCTNLKEVTFSCLTEWEVGDVLISAYELSDPAVAAKYLSETYADVPWTMSVYTYDETGNSIVSIEKTKTEGLVDTYTITFTNGTTTTFTVTNGEQGEQGVQGPAGNNGSTPYIKDNYWWIGDTNTGVRVSDEHNVRNYGAKGNGSTDDTAAFKAAISAAEADGEPVYVPAGTYLISNTLDLNSVTMHGYSDGAWTADNCDLPVILQTNLKAPLFHVSEGALSGLWIQVRGMSKNLGYTPAETIRISKPGSRISDMKISDPYTGIATYYEGGSGSNPNPGRCFLENIFIVNAYNIGVSVSDTYDVATLCNIEVWNPHTSGDNANTCPVAFKFGKNDDLRAVNLFAYNAGIGFLFQANGSGCWGSFSNCSTDYSGSGVVVDAGEHALTFIGGTYWNHHVGMQINGGTDKNTRVTANGCEISTNGSSGSVIINGGKMATVSGCNIIRTAEGHNGIPVLIGGCIGVSITGNTVSSAHTAAIKVDTPFGGAATITGNTVITSLSDAAGAIVNASAHSQNVVIANNAVMTNWNHNG